MIDLQANLALVAYLRTLGGRKTQHAPDPNGYLTMGTHPEIVERLWDQLILPEPCAWVLYERPVLVRPSTGIVFAFGTGHVYALRLPSEERAAADRAGASALHRFSDGSMLDLSIIGPEWRFGLWYHDEPDWCRAAYHAATHLN